MREPNGKPSSAAANEAATKQELMELENKFWRAIQQRDFETALDLADDPCIVTGPQGAATIGRDTFREMMQAATYRLDSFLIDADVHFHQVGKDCASLAYVVHERLTINGKPINLDAAQASTWVRHDGKWRCVLHAESIIGDPFGRDRKT